jgi:hypothetical protein
MEMTTQLPDLHRSKIQAAYREVIDALRIVLPDDAWRYLMTLLRVPEPRWAADTRLVSTIITTGAIFRLAEEFGDEVVEGHEQLGELAALARLLQEKTRALNRSGRLLLESGLCRAEHQHEADHIRRRLQYLEMLPTVVDSVFPRTDHLIANIGTLMAAAARHCPSPRRDGRPKAVGFANLLEFPRGIAFDLMIALFWRIADERGWHLTLSPTSAQGR